MIKHKLKQIWIILTHEHNLVIGEDDGHINWCWDSCNIWETKKLLNTLLEKIDK